MSCSGGSGRRKSEPPRERGGRTHRAARGSSAVGASTVGRPAGVSLSLDLTSPVVPEGMAGDAALSARSPVARPVAVTTSHRCPGRVRGTELRRREDRDPGEPVGVARRCRGPPPRSPARRTGRRPEVVGGCSFRAPTCWRRPSAGAGGIGLVLRLDHPKVLSPGRLPGPGRRCARRYVGHSAGRITPGQGAVFNSQGSPQTLPCYAQESRIHPLLIQSVTHSSQSVRDPVGVVLAAYVTSVVRVSSARCQRPSACRSGSATL